MIVALIVYPALPMPWRNQAAPIQKSRTTVGEQNRMYEDAGALDLVLGKE